MGHLTLGIVEMQLAMQVKSPIHSYGQDGDLTMKTCPRGGTLILILRIVKSPRCTPRGGGGLILLGGQCAYS